MPSAAAPDDIKNTAAQSAAIIFFMQIISHLIIQQNILHFNRKNMTLLIFVKAFKFIPLGARFIDDVCECVGIAL